MDANVVAGMAFLGATTLEIAEFVGCSRDVLERRYAGVLRKKRSTLRMRLRRAQIRLALEGNVTMLIWLGKQYLDWTDRPAAEYERPEAQPSQSIMIGGREIFF